MMWMLKSDAKLSVRVLIFVISFVELAEGVSKCYSCPRHTTAEQCYNLRDKTEVCSDSIDACFVQALDLINKTTGQPIRELYKTCTVSSIFCSKTKEELCSLWNMTSFIPLDSDKRLIGCSNYTCCKEDKCNTYQEKSPDPLVTIAPWVTDMSLCESRCCGNDGQAMTWQNRSCCGQCNGIALTKQVKCKDTFCSKLHCKPPYFVSPWTTDMNLCATKCCDSEPSLTWQNRSCFGTCTGVQLTQEIKCEETYCNEKHCGASAFTVNSLFIVPVVFPLIFMWD